MTRLLQLLFIFGTIYCLTVHHVIDAGHAVTGGAIVQHDGIKPPANNTTGVLDEQKISLIQQKTLYRFDEIAKRESVSLDFISEEKQQRTNSTNSTRRSTFVKDKLIPLNISVSDRVSLNQSDQQLLGQPQNFVPVTQFHSVPFRQQFRPPNVENQGPPRNFRHIQPSPQFFAGPHQFQGDRNVRDGRFFHNGPNNGHFFNRQPTGMQFRPMYPPPMRHSQRIPMFNQESMSNNNPSHFYDDDEHSSETTVDVLGSGNFNIIRGGIFADEDNPPPEYRNEHRPTTNADFFHGFQDFQPFNGAPSNAQFRNSPSEINISKVKLKDKVSVKSIIKGKVKKS